MLSKLKEIPRHQRMCQEILTLNNIHIPLERSLQIRGGVWPGKNHKYCKKRKLTLNFKFSFLLIFCFKKLFLVIKCCIIL